MRSLQLYLEKFLLQETSQPAKLSEQRRKKSSTWEQVGEAAPPPHHKPHPWHGDPQAAGNSKPRASTMGAKGLNSTLGSPNFKTCTCETSPQNFQGLMSTSPLRVLESEKPLLKGSCTQTHEVWAQLRGGYLPRL